MNGIASGATERRISEIRGGVRVYHASFPFSRRCVSLSREQAQGQRPHIYEVEAARIAAAAAWPIAASSIQSLTA